MLWNIICEIRRYVVQQYIRKYVESENKTICCFQKRIVELVD